MQKIERSVLLPYSAHEMFSLVAAIELYPRFLPWCGGTSMQRLSDSDVEATIEINYRGVRSRFCTRNHEQAPTLIDMQLVDGPFRELSGQWQFQPLTDSACKVVLTLQYEFAGGLLSAAVAPVFDAIAGSMVDAFTRRAVEVYGER